MSKFDIKTASLADITAEYNRLATELEEKTVKSFKDKATAEKRLTALQGQQLAMKAAKKGKAKPAADEKPKKKGKASAKDLLGEDDEDEKPKKKGKASAKDLLGEDDEDEKPKKKAKPAADEKPRGKNSLEKGKEPTFDHEPFSIQKEPREGTFRAKILGLLESENGTTVKQIEKEFQKYWDSKGGKQPKVDIHLRALEMLRLLRYQNGFGFKEVNGRIHALRAKGGK